jgi:RNA polymerase sigma-70 factor, ECF subfamily
MAAPAFIAWVTELARAHSQRLAGLARREGLDTAEALDAVQEAFHTYLQLPQARQLVDSPEESRALLSTIVKNAARNLRKRHHRARPHVELADAAELADESPSVDELLAATEDQMQLEGCLRQLDELERRVVTLRMLEELSGADVAAQLELTPGHVAVLLHRAKKDLLRCVNAAVGSL